MSFIVVVVMVGVVATCFVIGIVGGVPPVMRAVPLRRRPGDHREGPPPRPRRRG